MAPSDLGLTALYHRQALLHRTDGHGSDQGGFTFMESSTGLHDDIPRPTTLRQGCTCRVPMNRRPRHLKLKTVRWVVGCARQKLSPKLGRQCIWAELHETGGVFTRHLGSKSAGTLSCNPALLHDDAEGCSVLLLQTASSVTRR